MDQKIFEEVIEELEALDRRFREHGIPSVYAKKWETSVNVGLWIVGRATAEYLHDLVIERTPGTIVEIGTSVGYSALWLGKAAAMYGAHVWTFDRETFKTEEAREYLKRAGLSETVTCFTADATAYLNENWTEPIDFAFLDAGKREYLDYLNALMPHFAPGAILVADNMEDFAEQTQDFRETIMQDERFQAQKVALDHGLLVAQFASR